MLPLPLGYPAMQVAGAGFEPALGHPCHNEETQFQSCTPRVYFTRDQRETQESVAREKGL